MVKTNYKKIKSKLKYIIDSITPVSTKNLFFGEIFEIISVSDYITVNISSRKIGYTAIYKRRKNYKDVFTKTVYNFKSRIVRHLENDIELTILHLCPLPTIKRFVSKKTLIYMFNDYIKEMKNEGE